MNFLVLTLLCVIIGEAVSFSSLTVASVALLQLSQPAAGFFGLFRKRTSPKIVEQDNPEPKGPVKFSPSFANPGFLSSFGTNRFPGFSGGLFQGNRLQMPPFGNFPPQFPFGNFPPMNNFQQQPQFQPTVQQFQNPERPPQSQPSHTQNPQRPIQDSFEDSKSPFEPPQFQSPENDVQPDNMDSEHDFQEPSINNEEAESFFTLLAETDEHKCISRLVCELGADPENAGDLGSTIAEIIGSLSDFPEGSKVSEYNHILQKGREKGLSSCSSTYMTCDQESYQLMRDAQTDQGENANE